MVLYGVTLDTNFFHDRIQPKYPDPKLWSIVNIWVRNWRRSRGSGPPCHDLQGVLQVFITARSVYTFTQGPDPTLETQPESYQDSIQFVPDIIHL